MVADAVVAAAAAVPAVPAAVVAAALALAFLPAALAPSLPTTSEPSPASIAAVDLTSPAAFSAATACYL